MLTGLAWLIIVAIFVPVWALVSWLFASVAFGESTTKRSLIIFMGVQVMVTVAALAGLWAFNYLWGPL